MKQFEDLYNEIKVNEDLKDAWQKALSEKKKGNKKALFYCLTFTIIVLTMAISLIGFNLNNNKFGRI